MEPGAKFLELAPFILGSFAIHIIIQVFFPTTYIGSINTSQCLHINLTLPLPCSFSMSLPALMGVRPHAPLDLRVHRCRSRIRLR